MTSFLRICILKVRVCIHRPVYHNFKYPCDALDKNLVVKPLVDALVLQSRGDGLWQGLKERRDLSRPSS